MVSCSLRHILLVCAVILGPLAMFSGCAPKHGDIIVASIGDSTITMADYENLYIKSNGSREMGAKATMEEREKFLDLMTKFRLKLADAYRRGLDKSPEVLGEIDQYKGSLTAAYLTDREVTAPGVRALYDHRKFEYRASHILFTLTGDASPEDSAKTYAKAYEVINKLKAGTDFSELAMEYSQDPSVKQNKGDLYYFTAGQMVPPFEDTVFTMNIGQFTSTPVRTQFGLHIIKLTDKKPAEGEIQCSHIMTRFSAQDPTPEDTLEAYTRIKVIQDSLGMGIDFAELAKRNSADPGSAPRGGDLGWFSRRRWIQSFDEAAFKLKPGQVSGIVRTIYGYHLIKCYDAHPPKGFEDAKKDIQPLYQQSRFQADYKSFIGRLQTEARFQLHEDVLSRFIASLDSTTTVRDSNWTNNVPAELRASTIFSFGPRTIALDSAIALLRAQQDFLNTPLRASPIRVAMDKAAEQILFTVKGEKIEREYPEFAAIMKEYREGILLYQIEQDQVWNRIAVSDTALRVYFDQHRDKYTYPDRVEFTQLRFSNDSVANVAYEKLITGKTLADIAAADSVRMSRQNNYQLEFKQGSTQLLPQTKQLLDAAADELTHDAFLRIQFTAHPDTTTRKSQNRKLATQRLEAVKAYLKKKGDLAGDRVVTLTFPIGADKTSSGKKAAAERNSRIGLDLVGRKATVIGKVEVSILPVTTDERTKLADSLQVGNYSIPFKNNLGYSIIKVLKKDPAHRKTFEEAGTEISGGFQEYESKRLESEWLEGLQRAYPVRQYKEALKNAFAQTP